jgi:signal transduction histidine kinase
MMERLRRSNADLATFSHAMAHDLRNPLATIAMWTSVARMRAGPGDDAGPVLQVVDQIKDVADDAMELVSDLLHYAELDRGDTALEPVDLNLAAARVMATIGSSIAQQGAIIEAGNLPTVPGRPGELQLVLQNLIGNAIKYRSDQPPRIRLDALRDGEVWKIRCRDNGQGIPGSTREEVFEPFTRGQTSVPGSGLGLATCRRIIEGHGGRIWIASSGNLGTTVAFTLPVGPDPAPGEAEVPPTPAARSATREMASARGNRGAPPEARSPGALAPGRR